MSNNDVFQKRYKHIAAFLIIWIAAYFTLDSLFPDLPIPLTLFLMIIVPVYLLGYLVYEYFKLKIKRPTSLVFLLVLVAALILALLQFLKIVTLF
ncbi:hypothetical protein DB330_09950 [Lacticaseibacillus casei]|nr:hypothetical protein [Lacticaseibacillus casei]PTU93413.1 hypothetical protein DB330_09950 [Lacticaseibacillus casei]PTU98245.1 hypothetical protein DB326_06695 [Lacticaseibacillus casei]